MAAPAELENEPTGVVMMLTDCAAAVPAKSDANAIAANLFMVILLQAS
jgi:hypothetical protein